MALEINSSQLQNLMASISGDIETLKDTVVKNLAFIGETAVKRARDVGNYDNPTGCLRSSIGYLLVYNGRTIYEGGQKVVKGKIGDGSEGVAASQALLNRIKGELPSDKAVLVVTAGMSYAWYVENVHHRDVLASAELEADRLVKKLFEID